MDGIVKRREKPLRITDQFFQLFTLAEGLLYDSCACYAHSEFDLDPKDAWTLGIHEL